MDPVRLTAVLLLALNNAAVAAEPPVPPSPESLMALPECPASIPLGGDTVMIATPPIGRERTVSVGDAVLTSDPVRERVQAITFLKPFTFDGQLNGARFVVAIPAGTLREVDEFGSLRGATVNSYRLANATIRFLDANGQPGKPSTPKLWLLPREHATILHTEIKLGSAWAVTDVKDAPIATEPCRDTPYRAIERQILYGGVAKGVVTLQYREFVDRLARPAFDQQGTFDLAAGTEIGFKGVRLKILDASNTGLRYVVTKGFDE